MRSIIPFLGLIAAIIAIPTITRADDDAIQFCPSSAATTRTDGHLTPQQGAAADPTVHIHADQIEMLSDRYVLFTGNVRIQRAEQQVSAKKARYDKKLNLIEAEGKVILTTSTGDKIRTNALGYALSQHTGRAQNSHFTIRDNRGRGQAKSILFEGKGKLRLISTSFTSCPVGNNGWSISVSDLSLNETQDIGVARHAILFIKGIPVFYTPYIDFPLKAARRSGLLIPAFSQTNNTGFSLALPYYFNLAPNYDATLTLRHMSRRGMQSRGEFRYLGRHYNGNIILENLPRDRLTGTARYSGQWQHQQRFGAYTTLQLDLARASDIDYFTDLGFGIDSISQSLLPSQVTLQYRRSHLFMRLLAASYQQLDPALTPAAQPYVRAPQFILSHEDAADKKGAVIDASIEGAQFLHSTLESALRLNSRLMIGYRARNEWSHITARIGGYGIGYQNRSLGAPNLSIFAPASSLNAGLVFEREQGLRGILTLEPRLHYLHVAYINQNTLPILDTALAPFNYESLFADNRFIGGDRIGDSHQLTFALNSRLIGANGEERLRLSLGQIHYLADRRVSHLAPAPPPDITGQSDIAAEFKAHLGSVGYWQASALWNPLTRLTRRHHQILQIQPDSRRILSIAYRYDAPGPEFGDIALEWPLGRHWVLFTRKQWNLANAIEHLSYSGVEYGDCCLGIRLMTHRRTTPSGYANAFSLQIQLKGLAGSENDINFDRPRSLGMRH